MGAARRRACAPLVLGAAAGVLAACAFRCADVHLLRTASGHALVCMVRLAGGERVRVLQQGGVYQSATYLGARRHEPVFAYVRAFDRMFGLGVPVRRVLMLGGGGFSYPRHVLTSRLDVAVDVVEVDPAVVSAARRWFFLDEIEADPETSSRLRVIVADAREYLECRAAMGAARYDAIVNDTFSGREPVRSLATVGAAQAAKACLAPGGIYLTNVVSRSGGSDVSFLRDEVATLAEVFRHVHVVLACDDDLGGEDNYLVVATDGDWDVAGAVPFDDEFLGRPIRDA